MPLVNTYKVRQLTAKDVHLWLGLFSDKHDKPYNVSLLSSDEIVRADQFVRSVDRGRYIFSRALLRQVLSRYLAVLPEKIQFAQEAYGKLFIPEQPVHFNLSHSGDVVLLGLTLCDNIGVDIECVKPNKDFLSLAKRFFTELEFRAIASSENSLIAFYRCWTRKEAFTKATGLGLTFGLSNFEMSVLTLSSDQSALISVHGDTGVAKQWVVQSIPLGGLGSPYVAALALRNDVTIPGEQKIFFGRF